ncbi:MAG: hypothetical protein ACRC6M_10855 [Microcystaceae cyanobacterium]
MSQAAPSYRSACQQGRRFFVNFQVNIMANAKSNGSVATVEVAQDAVNQVAVQEAQAAVPVMKFAISIKTKSDRAASQLRDGLRILHWQEFKTEHKVIVGKGKQFADYLELYDVFDTCWKESEIQGLDLAGVEKFIDGLGYTTVEINKIRGDYYESKRGYQVTAAVVPINGETVVSASTEEIPY